MRNFFLAALLFSTILFAQNPIAFAALGDVIYNNVDKIAKLKNIDEYKIYDKKIEKYVSDVKNAKKEGFALENGSTAVTRKAYLNKLRNLAKTNDFFVHSVESSYEAAKKNQNSRLYSQIINTGLLDTNERKKEIIDYYFAHQEDMNVTGLIQSYLDEDAKLRAKKEAQQKRIKSKKEREAERIREIRENDRRQQELLEKKLQKELEEKKLEIREYQKEELKKTI
ncbi:hypothetical protein [Sulfurimonas paralvinellae]|uniref:DUF4142 domain-containing protein n=1 Tax=Sulfurimonas paralvinellae TaxID=317658 RepID=A0A7M1B5K1_9BACT|nr:hypothetical protein [Sulfurimonas paralvinellae]QOP45009.1 hypothetical protein FM071_01330 [Sulfurimonas paralvinellae]